MTLLKNKAGRTTAKKKRTITPKKFCYKCKSEKPFGSFYTSNQTEDGYMDTCKNHTRPVDINDLDDVRRIIASMDRLWDEAEWQNSINQAVSDDGVFGIYLKNIKMLNSSNSKKTFKDSKTDSDVVIAPKKEKQNENVNRLDLELLEKLKDKFGDGYPDEEYLLFEKKYQGLRTSFQLLTTMHDEYFREYCINRVKETLAKAKGDFKEAKEWAAMVKTVAEAGKLKPSQMSKADLSGGLDTFGQLARMVEEKLEIMPLLPYFIEKPKDKVDVTLWCYINYVRDLKGLPECEYKEIYEFYDRKKEDYENQMSDSENYGQNEEDDLDE
jgi:hypothetical protein